MGIIRISWSRIVERTIATLGHYNIIECLAVVSSKKQRTKKKKQEKTKKRNASRVGVDTKKWLAATLILDVCVKYKTKNETRKEESKYGKNRWTRGG